MAELTEDGAAPAAVHRYVSTACLHEEADGDPGLHQACRETCKFCDAPCACARHHAGELLSAPSAGWTGQARSIARELLRYGLSRDVVPPETLQRIEEDPALFWLRGEEKPPGTWMPAGETAP